MTAGEARQSPAVSEEVSRERTGVKSTSKVDNVPWDITDNPSQFFFFFKSLPHFVTQTESELDTVQTGLEFAILLPPPPQFWDER